MKRLTSLFVAVMMLMSVFGSTGSAHTSSWDCINGYKHVFYYRIGGDPWGFHGHTIIGMKNTYLSCYW